MISQRRDEKQKIASAFGRAAKHYDSIAHYQQNSGHQLLELLISALGHLRQKTIVDAGCGTGFFSQLMGDKQANVTAVDLSSGMLEVARNKGSAAHYICADMESLPFSEIAFDAVFSNLAIQWCSHLQTTLKELYRVTKPGGAIVFTTLAEGSLQELSQAWLTLDGYSHVNKFLDYQHIEASCQPWRHRLTLQTDKLYFDDLAHLLHSLKGIGATHLTAGRKPGLMTRKRLEQLASAYPTVNEKYALTYQTVFGVIFRD
ncbi:malonyl-ACP O-methyltransferase BioC [Providencia sneebia]|uniref:Malonyl-[acyl-carrier protein] O-methyltransferase n=1 Tax=Providencia sneebia DSM 19967 TaxID=1141660 RepID=K8WLD3_9GAMM|nr:malonyl-ACP O-methyltransferase BioC [Providencia sneebia]EKT58292.1 biotin biosynthesis protein [Providencia sneebia DSM 19967]